MDIVSRLPGCSGQAADAVSAYTQVKMEDAFDGFLTFQSQSVQIFGCVYQSTNGPIHGPAWKNQSFLLNEICTVILWQDCNGKGNLRKFYWNTVGKRFETGTVSLSTEQEDYSYQCMWTISNWQARQKTWNRLGKFT